MKIKYLQKVIFCIIIVSLISCFSSTENKKEISDEHNMFERVGNVYFDDLLNQSAKAKKPLLLYFTSNACVNCRTIEGIITNDQKLFSSFQNDYILVPLYITDKETLPKKEWFYSKIMQREQKTVGQKYLDWQMEKFQVNYQPNFVIVNEKGEKIKDLNYTRDSSEINDFFLRTE